jgi:hypothetical protein
MKYTITTYDNNGDEIVSRNYTWLTGKNTYAYIREVYADHVESILEDSERYLEEQALDNGEHECETDNSAGNVDADGTCLTCGKTDLI